MRAGALALVGGLAVVPALAQQVQAPDPFVMPPPTQRPTPPTPPGQGLPPATAPSVTLDVLVRQGFEIKAVERTSDRNPDFVVMLQRSGELRTCLMRIFRDGNQSMRRESACF